MRRPASCLALALLVRLVAAEAEPAAGLGHGGLGHQADHEEAEEQEEPDRGEVKDATHEVPLAQKQEQEHRGGHAADGHHRDRRIAPLGDDRVGDLEGSIDRAVLVGDHQLGEGERDEADLDGGERRPSKRQRAQGGRDHQRAETEEEPVADADGAAGPEGCRGEVGAPPPGGDGGRQHEAQGAEAQDGRAPEPALRDEARGQGPRGRPDARRDAGADDGEGKGEDRRRDAVHQHPGDCRKPRLLATRARFALLLGRPALGHAASASARGDVAAFFARLTCAPPSRRPLGRS